MNASKKISMLEIVFRDRNKNYGAYVLRRDYHGTMVRALLLTCGTSLAVLFGTIAFQKVVDAPIVDTGQVEVPELPRIIEVNLDKPETSKKISAAKPNNTQPEQSSQSASVTVSDTVQDRNAPDTAGVAQNAAQHGQGSQQGTTAAQPDAIAGLEDGKPVEPYLIDSLPEFEGGFGAIRTFIKRNVRYPSEAVDAGMSGIVQVSFVVDEKGNITTVTVLHSAGSLLDKEALRVVNKLPPFKSPGKKSGRAVKTRLSVPINFNLQ